jgi:hypothetical protein
MRFRLPLAARNPLAVAGIAIATAMAVLLAVLLLLQAAGYLTNPYLGLLVFVTIPAVFVLGLLLIPLGAWRARRVRATTGVTPEWPVIDLRDPRQRTAALAVVVLTIVNLVIVSMAAYGGVHYMESAAFCGQVCHTPMEPQAVAHLAWPHAEVACAQCHIGPGPGAFLDAKMAGTRQLVRVMTGTVPRPIPPPARLIQSAEVTCAQCHSTTTRRGGIVRVIREFGSDEANSEISTTLELHVGGPDGPGIHRHIGLEIEYVPGGSPTDEIPLVRARWPDGTVREYVAAGVTPDQVASPTRHRMTCTDCHNRPAHTFSPTPQRAVDRALADGRIPRDLPFVRREAVAAVAAEYPDRATANDAIAGRLEAFYGARPEAPDAGLVARAVSGVQQVWSDNVFPSMRVTWGTYPSHLGHVDSPGCFRCHTDTHTAGDGSVIRQDCALCHTFR